MPIYICLVLGWFLQFLLLFQIKLKREFKMGGGSSYEQHNAEIQKLKEQWQRTTEEERKKITEIMRQQNVKFEDLLNEKEKREQLIAELRKENVELKEEISGLKLTIESLTELVNKLAIVVKEDVDEDRCSVAMVWIFGIRYEKCCALNS